MTWLLKVIQRPCCKQVHAGTIFLMCHRAEGSRFEANIVKEAPQAECHVVPLYSRED